MIQSLASPSLLKGVWELLCRYDHAFLPPLSAREYTNQSDLAPAAAPKDRQLPYRYYEQLKRQSFVLALDTDRDEVAGFMSYRPHYVAEELGDQVATLYVTTVIVDEAYRGRGVTKRFYAELAAAAERSGEPIMTRTWSTNAGHLRILRDIGMEEIKRIEDGRGAGVDTVYYRQRRQEGPTSS